VFNVNDNVTLAPIFPFFSRIVVQAKLLGGRWIKACMAHASGKKDLRLDPKNELHNRITFLFSFFLFFVEYFNNHSTLAYFNLK
jgi:hypothetical protein